MMVSSLERNIFMESRDLSRISSAIKKGRDIIVISPPLSGLSEYLFQVRKYIQESELFSQHTLLFIDAVGSDDTQTPIQLREKFTRTILSQLGELETPGWTSDNRLLDFFKEIQAQNQQLKLIIVLDNIQRWNTVLLRDFLEQVRVIAEEKTGNVRFILGGHSINLRELDPECTSPFNTADRIWLCDFTTDQALTIIEKSLADSPIKISKYVPIYIDFLSGGHPYLIHLICSHLIMINEMLGTAPRSVNFRVVDEVVKLICEDGRDQLFQLIQQKISSLSEEAIELLKYILQGYRYDAIKTFPQIEELRLAGLITNSRDNKWHIRNEMYNVYIRRIKPFSKIAVRHIPRRLFINVEGYKLLFDLENDIRDFVVSKLITTYPDKWESKIEIGLLKKWENLKNEELKSGWYASEEYSSITYSLFPDLRRVIEDENNWSAIFHKYFKPKEVFSGYFANLEALRNKIAHNRPLNDSDIDRLEEISQGFINCMFD